MRNMHGKRRRARIKQNANRKRASLRAHIRGVGQVEHVAKERNGKAERREQWDQQKLRRARKQKRDPHLLRIAIVQRKEYQIKHARKKRAVAQKRKVRRATRHIQLRFGRERKLLDRGEYAPAVHIAACKSAHMDIRASTASFLPTGRQQVNAASPFSRAVRQIKNTESPEKKNITSYG